MTSAPLIAIRPGPVLHVFQNGREVVVVPLSRDAALCLIADLAVEVVRAPTSYKA